MKTNKGKNPPSDPRGILATEGRSKSIFYGFLFSAFLWLCVWATYNTDIYRFFSTGFPHSAIDLAHGLRSFLPFVAVILAIIFILKKRNLPQNFFLTPLGLLTIYTIIGIISSVFSKNPLAAMYWGVLYGSVLIVLLAVLLSSDPLKKLSFIININWVVVGLIAIILLAFFLFQPGIIKSINLNFLICGARPYEGLGNIHAEANTFGMTGSRPTGWGRYAGIASIVCLACFCFAKKKVKLIWLILFLLFLAVLIFSRGRTEVIGFLIAALSVFLLGRKYKHLLFFGIGLLIFLISFSVFYQSTCSLPVKNTTPAVQITKPAIIQETKTVSIKANPITFLTKNSNLLTLSGRTNGVWLDSWSLFLSNPLVGYGFQADRFFLNGQNAHNTILHALIQAGLLGTIPFVLAFIFTFLMLWRLLKNPNIIGSERFFLISMTGALVFFVVRGITESLAFFSADWFFVAPIIAYIQVLYFSEPNKQL